MPGKESGAVRQTPGIRPKSTSGSSNRVPGPVHPPEQQTDEPRFRLAAIVESSDDAIISKDLNGIITSWNAAAERMLEYGPDEILGHSVLKLIPPELHEQEPLILEKLRAGERIAHFETQRITKSGRLLEVSLTISPIRDDRGRVIGASKIMRDISDRKAMERSLLEAEKIATAGRMAASVAHEINNPLESVLNLIYLARSSKSMNRKTKEYLNLAEKEIERVSLIASQTLGFYRDRSRATNLCLHDVVDEVLTVYQSKLISKQISVERHFGEVGAIWLRKGEIIQVISNLIANAIDAMSQGGLLRVSVSEMGGGHGACLIIEDNGTGIEPAHQSKLFQPFFTTKQDRGNGLGLWVVRQIVEGLGGTINLESRTAGNKGTSFSIFLPYESNSSSKTKNARTADLENQRQ